jgi:hypothetical protein
MAIRSGLQQLNTGTGVPNKNEMKTKMKTVLIGTRKPTKKEKENGADVVFIRHDKNGREFPVLACKLYESWQQWGQQNEILFENVHDVEQWRKTQN